MNKQALNEALALVYAEPRYRDFIGAETRHQSVELILAAARLVERLLPGEESVPIPCPDDLGPNISCTVNHFEIRQVWDEGIVEAVAGVLQDNPNRADLRNRASSAGSSDWPDSYWEATARAVLSALVELLTEKVER